MNGPRRKAGVVGLGLVLTLAGVWAVRGLLPSNVDPAGRSIAPLPVARVSAPAEALPGEPPETSPAAPQAFAAARRRPRDPFAALTPRSPLQTGARGRSSSTAAVVGQADGEHAIVLRSVTGSGEGTRVTVAIGGHLFEDRRVGDVLATTCGEMTIVTASRSDGSATLRHDGRRLRLVVGAAVHL